MSDVTETTETTEAVDTEVKAKKEKKEPEPQDPMTLVDKLIEFNGPRMFRKVLKAAAEDQLRWEFMELNPDGELPDFDLYAVWADTDKRYKAWGGWDPAIESALFDEESKLAVLAFPCWVHENGKRREYHRQYGVIVTVDAFGKMAQPEDDLIMRHRELAVTWRKDMVTVPVPQPEAAPTENTPEATA